jgi:SM-20-related protein
VLWYISTRWGHDWGGETMFYDDANDARAAVTPRPGRLVIFDGELLHVGRPPNRNCYIPRYTLALKFERAND